MQDEHSEQDFHAMIADLKQELEATRQREHLLSQVIDTLPVVLYVKDGDGRMLVVNQAYAQAMNRLPEDLIGKTEKELFPPEVLQGWKAVDEELKATGGPVVTEFDITLPGGEQRTYQSTQFFVSHDAPEQPIIAGISRDITDMRQNEAALRSSQTLFQAIMDNLPFIFYINDLDGTFTLLNKFAANMVGVSPEDLIGKKDSDLFPPEVVAVWRKHNQEVIERGAAVEKQEPAYVDGEPRTNLSVKFPLYDEQGNVTAIAGVSTDITDLKRAEEERVALKQQIIDTQRETLRELSTPLIPIASDVVIMPLIGAIDSGRAQMILENLLTGVAALGAETVILDVTGVQVVDDLVANTFIQAARAVQLLGARVILTGIQPPVAQNLVESGINLSGIITHSSVQTGIAYALKQHHLAG